MNVHFRLTMYLSGPDGKPVESYSQEHHPKGAALRRDLLEKRVLPEALDKIIRHAIRDGRDLPPWLLSK